CLAVLGTTNATQHVVYNGSDKSTFFPDRSRIVGSVWNLVMTGNFREVDMIMPLLNAVNILRSAKKYGSFELHIVGPVLQEYRVFLEKNDYIIWHGAKASRDVAEILRSSDVFVYSFLNPPCPNSVIEAISCGLPVVGFDSGSMSEL